MKKAILAIISLAAFVSVSCQKEKFGQGDDSFIPAEGEKMELRAGFEGAKATISGYLMHWTKYDTLIVFDNAEKSRGIKFSTTENDVEAATFTTPFWSGNAPTYAASYSPSYGEDYAMEMSQQGIITMKFRQKQTLMWTNTCSRYASACVGKVEIDSKKRTFSLPEMKNIMSFIRFRIAESGVKAIEVEAIGGEDLTGWVDVDYAKLVDPATGGKDFWTPTPDKAMASKITVDCQANAVGPDGTFKPGAYYFSILPQTYSQGIKFTLKHASGEDEVHSIPSGDYYRNEIYSISRALDDNLPETIVIDLPFYNADGINPLGFGAKTKDSEDPEIGETYNYTFEDGGESYDFPIVLCKGKTENASYSYYEMTLVYPDGVKGKCLVFSQANGWIKAPAIPGHYLQEILYEHGNGFVKQMAVKEGVDGTTIAYSSSHGSHIATAQGPNSEKLSFYSDVSISENIVSNPKENTPYYLKFTTGGGVRLYRIRLTYKSDLPKAPSFPSGDSDFPRLEINTHGKLPILTKDDYVYGSIHYTDVAGIYPGATSVGEDQQTARFKGRGNSTWKLPKKPYRIKLSEKLSFFDLKKDKDWCVLANYTDKSLMRNLVAMEISRRMDFPWTPGMYSVEFWLNGQYQGLYTLSEHKKVSSGRIDIVPPEDGGSDMYLEVDQGMDELCCFYSATDSIPVMFNTPEEPDATMLAETKAWFDNFELALHSPDFPASGYEAFIDVDSFVDHYIIQELAKNVDGRMNKGAFLTRTTGGPIKAYHEWDFDIAFGNDCDLVKINPSDKSLSNGPEGWLIKNYTHGKKDRGWYPTLFTDPAFVQKVKDRWNELYPSLQTIPAYIDEQAALIAEPAERNFQRWPELGTYVWPNVVWPKTYAEEVAYLKDFYVRRLDWLNTNINAL